MISHVTDLAKWKAAHSRPVVIDCCRWSQALESIARANLDAYTTMTFIWPRVLLRTAFGI